MTEPTEEQRGMITLVGIVFVSIAMFLTGQSVVKIRLVEPLEAQIAELEDEHVERLWKVVEVWDTGETETTLILGSSPDFSKRVNRVRKQRSYGLDSELVSRKAYQLELFPPDYDKAKWVEWKPLDE